MSADYMEEDVGVVLRHALNGWLAASLRSAMGSPSYNEDRSHQKQAF